jgi:hypothetical protein
MLKRIFFLFIATTMMFACGAQSVDNTKKTGKPQSFGAKIKAKGAVGYTDMLTKMATVDSMAIKVRGTVKSVCQKKGCWMNISDGQTSKEMFVQFKDYGFFMPLDITGREVIMQGYAYRDVTSVEDLRHFAEDKGKSKEEIEAITEPKEELKFLASGVLLLPEGSK